MACTPKTEVAGRVHVEGNQFVDPQGFPIIFRGLCFSDPVKLERDGHWNEEYFAKAAEWGANIVRFAVHPQNIIDTIRAINPDACCICAGFN